MSGRNFARAAFLGRLTLEVCLVSCALLTAEALVTAAAPATWTNRVPVARHLELHKAARKLDIPFDARTISEVVDDLRSEGVDAFPGISRSWARDPIVRQQLPVGLYPLSHASNALIVECNETGRYLTYRSDEFGFNNPSGLIASGEVDIAVVGESHALGHCLPTEHTLVGRLRRTYPRVANFALADTRSLSQLATFREYVEPLRPPVVLWVINPGYASADKELDDPVLRQYWDVSFSQRLLQRRSEVDAAIRSVSYSWQSLQDREFREEAARARLHRFDNVLTLRQIRRQLDPTKEWVRGAVAPPDLSSFRRSLELAQEATKSWDGRLLVLVLPAYGQLLDEEPERQRYRSVMRVVKELGIPAVDGASLFLSQPDPARLYALRMRNHPNESGYALLANQLTSELRQRFPLRLATAERLQERL